MVLNSLDLEILFETFFIIFLQNFQHFFSDHKKRVVDQNKSSLLLKILCTQIYKYNYWNNIRSKIINEFNLDAKREKHFFCK